MTVQPSSDNKPLSWAAHWIWYPAAQDTVNFHCFARKAFQLASPVREATLHISVYTDYTLYINGTFVGRGPLPGDPSRPFYDTYEVANLLAPGENVLAVLCHNYGVGTHWRHKGPGGLIAQLGVETGEGRVTVATDGSWKMRPAACYRLNSPRVFWSAGFMETFDFRRLEEGWRDQGFDDSAWKPAGVLGPHPTGPWRVLLPRDIPMLQERFIAGQAFEHGRYVLPRVHVISFESLLPPGQAGLVYAETFVRAENDEDLVLHLSCDDAFKAFVNGEVVHEQNYNEDFARTRIWRGLDEYDQVHYGMTGGGAWIKAPMRLRPGWNHLTLAVDQGPDGWGVLLAFLRPGTDEVIEPVCAADRQTAHTWHVAGPFESTGMSDSLDHVASSLDDLRAPTKATHNPFQYGDVTDYAVLMAYEQRQDYHAITPDNAITLHEGEGCLVDLGDIRVGFPALDVESAEEAVLDIGYGQVLFGDRRIRFSNDGMMKIVDRVYTGAGHRAWQSLQRRTARYLHVSCRKGSNVRLSRLGIQTIGYPVARIGHFECSDPALNRIWEVSRYTTELLMQYGYQDCLKREEGTINPSSFNYASRAAMCCFGDTLLARRGLRTAILNQHDDGWFDGHGISSPNSDEITHCLWWIVWLKDYLLYSGDRAFAAEVFEGAENNLRFFTKMTNRHGLIDGRNYHVYRQGQHIYIDDTCVYGRPSPWVRPVDSLNGEVFGFNVLFYAALDAAATIADTLGLAERAAYYHKRADRVRRSCQERFWDEAQGLYAEGRVMDEIVAAYHPVVQIAALYFGLCDARQRRRVLDYLVGVVGLPTEDKTDYPLNTFGFYYYFLETLFANGFDDQALVLMRTYYGSWLEAGATTFGEFYHMARDNREGFLDAEFEVHAYGASAHLHFYTNILGVRPLEPGFGKVLIAPHPGDLQAARGVIATPAGQVRVVWETTGDALYIEIELPQGCGYEVALPRGYPKSRLKVNGTEVSV
ncbi:MAG: hypothetical protein Kow00106_21850 [Anaerolineae bacterium]